MLTLDVVIPTYLPDGIERVAKMKLPSINGVNYIISWQAHQDYEVPHNLLRDDIKILRMEGVGLSRNRNNGILNSEADIIYIADDDLEILPGALEKIRDRYREYPDTDVATFKMKEENGKTYPEEITDLQLYLPKNYCVSSCELTFRRKISQNIRFNTLFGINSGCFGVGEEEIFHLEARKKGYKCRYFPDIIASHPHESTGIRRINDPKVIEGFGAVITKQYPHTFILRLPLKAYRIRKNKQYGFLKSMYYLTKGMIKSFRVKV